MGGTLVGSYEITDKATRNALLIKLSEDPKVHLGKLVKAFELSREQLRRGKAIQRASTVAKRAPEMDRPRQS